MPHDTEPPSKTQPLRVAVLADTHGRLPPAVSEEACSADEIWHLGDFCDLAMLDTLRALGPPFFAVAGNNDSTLDLPRRLRLARSGFSFLLVHIPPDYLGGADFLLHGHTHVPRDEQIGTVRVLNPGSVGKADKGAPASWAWLTIDPGRIEWTLRRVPAATRR